jgi:aryl-alcohol dehydrogenase-like predicted oxidoreductase
MRDLPCFSHGQNDSGAEANVKIPAMGLGTWVFGGRDWGGQPRNDSVATLHGALDAGIRHLDVAQAYGSGLAEEIVGEVLVSRNDGDQIVLASKTFTKTPEKLRDLIDRSRQRLQRDCIDLYYLHWPRRNLDLRPLLAELEAARQRGWIRAIGVSNFSIEDLESVREVAQVDALQLGWNLIWRQPEEKLLGYCRDRRIPIVAYSALAQGILTGKFPRKPQFSDDDFRPRTIPFRPEIWPQIYDFVDAAGKTCAEHGTSLPRVASAWLLAQGADAVLFGARTPTQLTELLPRPDLSPELHQSLNRLSDDLQQYLPDAPNFFDYRP